MEYRKVGRGGAGNYYSKNDIEAAAKQAAQQKDLEAQKASSIAQSSLNTSDQPRYASSGRGGAGNLAEASTLASAPGDPADINPTWQNNSASGPTHHGRGGAGNYAGSESEAKQQPQQQETELQEMKHRDIYARAEAGLQEPERAHLGGQKSLDEV